MPEVQRTCLRLEKRLDISKLIENMTMNWESSSFKSMRTMGWWRNSMPISQFDSKCPLTIHWVFQLFGEQNKNWWFRIRSSIFSFYVRQEIHNSTYSIVTAIQREINLFLCWIWVPFKWIPKNFSITSNTTVHIRVGQVIIMT